MANQKTTRNDNNIKEFLNKIENEGRKNDSFRLLEIFAQTTIEEPQMWGPKIIGYGNYHYKYESGREGDWFLAGFSPGKHNLSLYLPSGFDAYQNILSKLGKYKTGKSCLYIKSLSDVNLENLKTLIGRSYRDMKERYG